MPSYTHQRVNHNIPIRIPTGIPSGHRIWGLFSSRSLAKWTGRGMTPVPQGQRPMCRWLWIILNNKDSPFVVPRAVANTVTCWEVRAGVLHEEYADCDLLDEEAPAITWGRQGAPSASYLSLWRPETHGVSLQIEGTVSINTNTKEVNTKQVKSQDLLLLADPGLGLLAAQCRARKGSPPTQVTASRR